MNNMSSNRWARETPSRWLSCQKEQQRRKKKRKEEDDDDFIEWKEEKNGEMEIL